MNRKILSALLIAVITFSMYIQSAYNVTNENQETEKLTVVEVETELNSGIIKELSSTIDNPDKDLQSGIMKELRLDLNYILNKPSMSINETEVVSTPEPEVITPKFTSTLVNCRTGSNSESESIMTFKAGTEIQTVGEENGWVRVKLEDNTYGYICGDYVRDTNPLQYIGEFKLTYYTDSVECCGKANQPTASGVYPVDGITVAADSSIPFGTKLYIDGNIYTVQDRGGAIKGNVIDIFKDLPHEALLQLGVDYADVYIYNE